MPVVSDSQTLATWIREQTQGAKCVVDLGAGFFDKLRYVPPMTKKIGIEVFPAYLGYAQPGTRAVLGDIREWWRFVAESERDVAMCIDTIEHMSKGDGITLLRTLKDSFRKVLVMTPEGYVEQAEDVTGYENQWQVHECGWTVQELNDEGFSVEVIENFHPHLQRGAIFAVWERP